MSRNKSVLADFEKIYNYIEDVFLEPDVTKVKIFYEPSEGRIKVLSVKGTISFLTFVVGKYIPNIENKYDLQNNVKEFISDFSQYLKTRGNYRIKELTDFDGILLLQQ